VDNTASSKNPEEEGGSGESRLSEDVENGEAEEGEDVLHVIEVGASYSFYILIGAGIANNCCVFRGNGAAGAESLPGCQESHGEHLDNDDGRVESKSPKQLPVNVQAHPLPVSIC